MIRHLNKLLLKGYMQKAGRPIPKSVSLGLGLILVWLILMRQGSILVLFDMLIKGDWIAKHENCAIIGPTGIGKSWLACALGHKACRDNRSVLYTRLPRLIEELALAKGDGRIAARMKSLARVDLLILDDWGLEPLDSNARHHLLEILEDRYGRRATLVTSQLPVARWHELIGDPTYADAILDRLVHNAHRLEISGESMRRHTTAIAA